MTAYMFSIDSMVQATMTINTYGIILWQPETYLVNKKWEIHTIHRLWLSRRWLIAPWLQVVGHMPRKYLQFVWYSRETFTIDVYKFRWWQFGKFLVGHQFCQILAMPKFPSIYHKRGKIYWAKLSRFLRILWKFFHEYLAIAK